MWCYAQVFSQKSDVAAKDKCLSFDALLLCLLLCWFFGLQLFTDGTSRRRLVLMLMLMFFFNDVHVVDDFPVLVLVAVFGCTGNVVHTYYFTFKTFAASYEDLFNMMFFLVLSIVRGSDERAAGYSSTVTGTFGITFVFCYERVLPRSLLFLHSSFLYAVIFLVVLAFGFVLRPFLVMFALSGVGVTVMLSYSP